MPIYAAAPQGFFRLLRDSFAGFDKVLKSIWYLILISACLGLIGAEVFKLNHHIGIAVFVLIFFVFTFIYAIVLYRSDGVLAAKPVSMREAISVAKKRYLRLLGAYIVMMVIITILAAVDFGVWALTDALKIQFLEILLTGIVGLLTIFVVYLVVFAIPLIVLGNHGVFKSYEDSIKLVWGNWWRVFGILLIIYFVLIAVALLGAQLVHLNMPVIMIIWHFIYHFISYPLVISATLVLLHDLRMRKPTVC